MGIPVIGIANGTMPDGIVAEYSLLQGVAGAISAEYLATKLKKGDEVVTFWNPGMLISKVTHSTAKGLLEGHGRKSGVFGCMTAGRKQQEHVWTTNERIL